LLDIITTVLPWVQMDEDVLLKQLLGDYQGRGGLGQAKDHPEV
jgi:hypothetical protein